jgi:hypothetical protein
MLGRLANWPIVAGTGERSLISWLQRREAAHNEFHFNHYRADLARAV